jgi:hypothetical protein
MVAKSSVLDRGVQMRAVADAFAPEWALNPSALDETPAFPRGVDELAPRPDVNTDQVTATRSRSDTAVGRIR